MSDPPYLVSDNTTAPFSTPSTTPLTSHKTLVADSQGCIHQKKCHNLQRVNKRIKVTVEEMKNTIKELNSVSI